MLQVRNRTPLQVSMGFFPDEKGIDTVYAAVKATYSLVPEVALLEKQEPVRLTDEYHGKPGDSSLKYAGEMALTKAATDVFLLGHAYAPRGKAPAVDVTLRVGARTKAVRVFGDRYWMADLGTEPKPSDPVPFDKIPLVWERAFGGVVEERSGKKPFAPANPVGTGFWTSDAKEGPPIRLPNLEDPRRLIASISDRPAPVCFAPVASHWQPRLSFAGTYDGAWQKSRMPYLPADFDVRFFNSAPADLVFSPYLAGGEDVEIVGASPGGRIAFRIPALSPSVAFVIAGQRIPKRPCLDTVTIEPDENRLSLVWRTSEPCDKKTLKVELLEVDAASLRPAGAA